jgi:glycosyltransferase involved in cell wall biosynthesis
MRQAAGDLARLVADEDVDLLHLHTPFSIALGRVAGQWAQVPSVSVVHGTPLDQTGAGPRVFSAVERRMASHSSRIVTLNAEDFEAYRQFAPDVPVTLAPGGGAGVALPFVTGARASTTSPSDGPVALFLGRPAPGKNLMLLKQAWELARQVVPDLRLRIVGGPSEGDRVPDPVDTPEFTLIPHDREPLTEINGADILVSASAREGFGMSVAEALFRGVPVACVTNRGARQIAQGVRSGLVLTDATPQSLAAGMVQALSQRVELTDAARHDWSRDSVVAFHLHQIRQTLDRPDPDRILSASH